MEIPDYPGLLRIVSWVINGLELRVENAQIMTDSDLIATNTFYITDYLGRKLEDSEAEMLQTRLMDTINICIPAGGEVPDDAATDYMIQSGPFTVHNKCDEQLTEIVVQGSESRDNGSLLEMASVLTGVGLSVRKGVIQSCEDCEVPIKDPKVDNGEHARLFRFYVVDNKGQQLDSGRASALLYTLRMLRKGSFQPLTPPGKFSYY